MNDQETIPGDGDTNNCSISISFKENTFYQNDSHLPNGPATSHSNGWRYFGLGFTVTATTKGGGGVGHIGTDSVPENKNGKWTIEQWTSSYATQSGKFVVIDGRVQNGGPSWMDISNKIYYTATKNGRTFSYYDRPSLKDLSDTFKNQSFYVKVYNGNQFCQASFHLVQRDSTVHWGPR